MPTATDVVRLLTCVQSEECAHAFWSLGLRCSAATMAVVQAEFDAGRFLRTHILRPTWHLVPAEDIRWILIMNAELEALICSGRCAAHSIPMRCLDKRVSSGGLNDGDLPQLARRFLAGHGPASAPNFARWASLTSAQARAAVAEVAGELEAVEEPMSDCGAGWCKARK